MKKTLRWMVLAAVLFASMAVTAGPGAGPELVFTNQASATSPAPAGGDSYLPVATPDGRYVLFSSTAANLVTTSNAMPMQTYSMPKLNVYRHDRVTGQTVLASEGFGTARGVNRNSVGLDISADGRFALLVTPADNLVGGDTNQSNDVFLLDLEHGITHLVTAGTNGRVAHGWQAVMTPDARRIAFTSRGPEHVAGDSNYVADVFVRDRESGSTVWASPGGLALLGGGSDSPVITPNSRYVAFLSMATNLVAGSTNAGEVYVRDLETGETKVASLKAHELLGPNITSYSHALSDDGRFVAFIASSNMAATAGVLIRQDLVTGALTLISTNVPCPRSTFTEYREFRGLDMSEDGRLIVFLESVGKTSSRVRLWNADNGQTITMSVDQNGREITNAVCEWPSVSPDGTYVAFTSDGTNLVPQQLHPGFHLYVKDTQLIAGAWVADFNAGTAEAPQFVNAPRWAREGRFLVFDAVTGFNGPHSDVFITDVTTGSTELVSKRAPELPSATPVGQRLRPEFSISGDARYVAFVGPAPTSGQTGITNTFSQVLVRDRVEETNFLVSVSTNGVAVGNGSSSVPRLSADGRTVVFTSAANNLVPGDGNSAPDIFTRDLNSDTTRLVSVSRTGTAANSGSTCMDVSPDGVYVLFRSRATDFVPGQPNLTSEKLVWRDTRTGITRVITNSFSAAAMAAQGRYVAFTVTGGPLRIYDAVEAKVVYQSTAALAAPLAITPDGSRAAGFGGGSIYLLNRVANTQTEIATYPANLPRDAETLAFSGDGAWLVFTTPTAQVPEDVNGQSDVYLYNVQIGVKQMVSRRMAPDETVSGASDKAAISDDGRFIVFRSSAKNLVPVVVQASPNVYLHDRVEGTTSLLTPRNSRVWDSREPFSKPVFSPGGNVVAFVSWAADLVANDYNQEPDLFVMRINGSGFNTALKGEIMLASGGSSKPVLTWRAEPGKTYSVEYKDALDEASWKTLATSIEVRDGRAMAMDSTSGLARRFYRIVEKSP